MGLRLKCRPMSETRQTTDKTVFLETFGCQMNVLDSELVAGALRGLGYAFTDERDKADVVLFNTCSVRQNAEDKVYGRLGEVKHLKKANPNLVVGVIGCMAERDGAHMMETYPQVDLMCGPGELDKVPMLIDNVAKTRDPQLALQGNNTRRSTTLDAAADDLEMLDLSRSISAEEFSASAYVRITRGCNKFCTYCVVPYTRGAEVHRPPDHIVDECKRLVDAGIVEITLLGQTVNHYRYDHGAAVAVDGVQQPQIGPGLAAFVKEDHKHNVGRKVTTFADLLKRIHDEVPGVQRLRFVTSYPRDFGDDILKVMAESERICNYLHVPAQHGSDRVLKLMNRDYTVAEYLAFIDRVRHFMPDAMIASDFIVGFPTETEEEFQATVDLLKRCQFKNSFIFKYSPRPGTIAIDRFEDDIPDHVKRDRNNRLLAAQAETSLAIHEALVGETVEVLVEGVSNYTKKNKTNVELKWESSAGTATVENAVQLSGRTRGDLITMFDGERSLIGEIVKVKVRQAKPLTLFGELVG